MRRRREKFGSLVAIIIILLIIIVYYTFVNPNEQIREGFQILLILIVTFGLYWIITDS